MSDKCGRLFAFGFACFFSMWCLFLLLQLANPIVDKQALAYRTGNGTAVSDFVLFYQAGAMCLSDQRTRIYDPAVQLEFTNRLIKPEHIDKVFYIQYPPFFFPLMAPLTMLSPEAAYALWYGLSLVVGLSAITLLINDSKRFSALERLIILMATLSSAPSLVALKLGQVSWFLLGFLCLLYLACKRSRDGLGGASLALFAVKPQYLPLFLVSILSLGRWRLLFAGFVFEALLLALAGLTVGWGNVYNYPFVLMRAETTANYSGVYPEGMVSIRGALSTLLPQWGVLAIALTLLALSALLVYALWQQVVKNRLSSEWAMALTTVLCLVVSPHSHVYDLLLLSLAAVLTLPNLNLVKMAALPSRWLRLWLFILVSYPFVSWIAYCFGLSWLFLLLNLLLLIAGLTHVYTERSSVADIVGALPGTSYTPQ